MGIREPVSDTARILSRYVDVIIVRTFAQSTLETLAQYSSVPVINASLGRRASLPGAGRSPYRLREEGRTEGDNHRLHWRWQQRGRQPCPGCRVGGGQLHHSCSARLSHAGRRHGGGHKKGKGYRSQGYTHRKPPGCCQRRRRSVHGRVDEHGAGGRDGAPARGLQRVQR